MPFVEELYAEYLKQPESVPADWRGFFKGLDGGGNGHFVLPGQFAFPRESLFHARATARAAPAGPVRVDQTLLQEKVGRLIHAYRVRGHIVAGSTRWVSPGRLRRSWGSISTACLKPISIGRLPPR